MVNYVGKALSDQKFFYQNCVRFDCRLGKLGYVCMSLFVMFRYFIWYHKSRELGSKHITLY